MHWDSERLRAAYAGLYRDSSDMLKMDDVQVWQSASKPTSHDCVLGIFICKARVGAVGLLLILCWTGITGGCGGYWDPKIPNPLST